MALIVPLIIVVILNAVYFANAAAGIWSPEFSEWKDLVVIACAVYVISALLLRRGAAKPAAAERPQLPKRERFIDAEIVHFLSLLQEKGRFIDFLMDDITPYSNEQVGTAARVVHQGCAAVLRDYFEIAPVRKEQEGSTVRIESEAELKANRLVGKAGALPAGGRLLHKGWQTSSVKLPRVVDAGADGMPHIIAPAEVEAG